MSNCAAQALPSEAQCIIANGDCDYRCPMTQRIAGLSCGALYCMAFQGLAWPALVHLHHQPKLHDAMLVMAL